MIDHLLLATRSQVRGRAWLICDLQQTMPERSRESLTTAVDDLRTLPVEIDEVWYLGDAIEGTRPESLEAMTRMQIEVLGALKVPIRYIMGNHDFDCLRKQTPPCSPQVPFYEAIGRQPDWQTIPTLDSFWFEVPFAGYRVFFLSDHAALDGSWYTSHDQVRGGVERYPHDSGVWQQLAQRIASSPQPVITAGHYAFPGGNRATAGGLLERLLPLAGCHKLHFYGHSHIGDVRYGKAACHRKIAYVDYHRVMQINVSSLENHRGDEVRSTLLEVYNDGSLGLFFRHHTQKLWAECLTINPKVTDLMGATALQSWPAEL
jgi:hypothetical protein